MENPCSTNGEKEELMGNREVKRQLRITRGRWVDDITMDLEEIEWGGMDWIVVVRVPGYSSRDPSSIPGATRFPEK
jgi:hypothetical protein